MLYVLSINKKLEVAASQRMRGVVRMVITPNNSRKRGFMYSFLSMLKLKLPRSSPDDRMTM